MNAAETIAAAIQKLESRRAESTPGPWAVDDDGVVYTLGESVLGGTIATWDQMDGYPRGDYNPMGDMHLIVTLHDTIDAQLAILDDDASQRLVVEQNPAGVEIHYRNALLLARSIIGES